MFIRSDFASFQPNSRKKEPQQRRERKENKRNASVAGDGYDGSSVYYRLDGGPRGICIRRLIGFLSLSTSLSSLDAHFIYRIEREREREREEEKEEEEEEVRAAWKRPVTATDFIAPLFSGRRFYRVFLSLSLFLFLSYWVSFFFFLGRRRFSATRPHRTDSTTELFFLFVFFFFCLRFTLVKKLYRVLLSC